MRPGRISVPLFFPLSPPSIYWIPLLSVHSSPHPLPYCTCSPFLSYACLSTPRIPLPFYPSSIQKALLKSQSFSQAPPPTPCSKYIICRMESEWVLIVRSYALYSISHESQDGLWACFSCVHKETATRWYTRSHRHVQIHIYFYSTAVLHQGHDPHLLCIITAALATPESNTERKSGPHVNQLLRSGTVCHQWNAVTATNTWLLTNISIQWEEAYLGVIFGGPPHWTRFK